MNGSCAPKARQFSIPAARSQPMSCAIFAVGVTAAREAGLFRGLEADDSDTDGATGMSGFDGVWPGCGLTVVSDICRPHTSPAYRNVFKSGSLQSCGLAGVVGRWQSGLQCLFDRHQPQGASSPSSYSSVLVRRAMGPTGACESMTPSMSRLSHPRRRGSA